MPGQLRPALDYLVLFSPSGALIDEKSLDRAVFQLEALGFITHEMPQARLREQRFAGCDKIRARSIEQACSNSIPCVLMATRGGYGLTRLLSELKWSQLVDLLNQHGHVLCGHSDVTCLQLGLLKAGALPSSLLHGPMACFDFGVPAGLDAKTEKYFLQAVRQGDVHIEWAMQMGRFPGQTSISVIGPVWGGNLTMLCSLLHTPWSPDIRKGILVLEDVNEPVYKIERMLLQLFHAGILQQQQAILLGNFSEPKASSHDNGYMLENAIDFLREKIDIPVFTNFPFGHCTPKACWFQGLMGHLIVQDSTHASLIQKVPGSF